MEVSYLLLGLVPVLCFVLVDCFAGLKAGIVSAMILAVAECGYTIYRLGKLDLFALISTLLIILFGVASLKTQNSKFFKFQPVVIGTTLGLAMLGMQAYGEPSLIFFAKRYELLLPPEMKTMIRTNEGIEILRAASISLSWALLFHAGLIAYSAIRLSNWWWLATRGLGLYLSLAVAAILTKISI